MNQTLTPVQVSLRNGVLNAILAVVKLTVGWLCCSQALVSDGAHGIADSLSAAVVIVGLRAAAKAPDRRFPYGRDRTECVAAMLLAVFIGLTGLMLGAAAVQGLCSTSDAVAGEAALWVALGAIVLKEWMFRATRRAAICSGSSALMADALHQRTDVLSSLGSAVGIVGARCGWPLLDPLAALLISAMILKTAVDIFADAARRMLDCAADEETENVLRSVALEVAGVASVKALKTRLFGSRVYVELTVCVDGSMCAVEAYGIAENVRRAVEKTALSMKACGVYIHPIGVANSTKS